MLQVTQKLLEEIEKQIDTLSQEYQRAQGLILTEDDLKCLLYGKLSEIPELWGYDNTMDDGIRANKIHCEVSWYDQQGKLTIKPDITILDPQHLSILRGIAGGVFPTKGFNFDGDAVIFELKFIRKKSGVTSHCFEKEIRKDWEKIQGLFHKLRQVQPNEKIYCFFVVFSKVDRVCHEFQEFLIEHQESDNHKVVYRTGQVEFVNRQTLSR